MRRYRFLKVFLLWIVLGTVFPGAASLNAFDRIPREWTEMTMDDIDPSPFSWAPGLGSVCKVRSYPWLDENCSLDLRVPASWHYTGYYEITLDIAWSIKELAFRCKKICEEPDNEGEYFVRSKDRDIFTFAAPIGGTEDYRVKAWKSRRKAFPAEQVKSIMRDVVMKLELYAAPCNCPGQPVRPTGETTSRPRPTPPTSPVGDDLPPESEVPPSTIRVPDLLGQGDGEPGTTSGGSLAMRRASGGFPPGVKVTSLKFFESPAGSVNREARSYNSRFNDRTEYLNFELNLTYPARTERFPFELELVVLRDGQPHVKYTQGGYFLESGWTNSWHEIGWGRDGGGIWKPGSYRAELSVKGKVVATGTFQVVASER
jgi:hypothetical protein